MLWAPDYDGGHKAWVRWDETAATTSCRAARSSATDVALAYGLLAGGGLCARVGERVLDLSAVAGSLDELMARGPAGWAPPLEGPELDAPELALPFTVADYVDFYSSLHHARNVGLMFRPDDEPLLPNWLQMPVGYHGRAGTVVPSGTTVRRPNGQLGEGEFGPTRALDVELELGFVIGVPSDGPVPVERALDHVSAPCS